MYAYSNNGESMRTIDSTSTAATGEVVFDSPATDAQLLAAFPNYVSLATRAAAESLVSQARTALSNSDVQVIRCYESGGTLPTAWVTYRSALRVIVSSGAGTIPTVPAWPTS
jgi:hypothetical protein